MVSTADGRHALPEGRERVPLMYTVTAVKEPRS
jgi:hypothetical protein